MNEPQPYQSPLTPTAVALPPSVSHWPLWIGSGSLVAATVCYVYTGRVPNVFVVPVFLAGLLVAIAKSVGRRLGNRSVGGIPAALLAALSAACLVMPLWVWEVAPGGTVKMQIAFCCWIGCGLGLTRSLLTAIVTTVTAILLTAVAFLAAPFVGETWPQLLEPWQGQFPTQLFSSLGSIAGLLLARTAGIIESPRPENGPKGL